MSKTQPKAENKKIHVCSQCGSAFNRPYRLKQHETIHQNIKQFVCGEANCNKSYTNKSHLDRHIYSVHMDPVVNVIYSCPECMKVYVNRQNLKRHIKVHHGKKTVFTCDVCNNNFKKKHQLSAHMYQHTFVKSFSCDLCSGEFVTLLEKKRHMKHHKTYSCDLCDMAFVQWSKYLKHKKNMHKEYQCNDCGRKFTKRVHMVHHAKTHNTCYTPKFHPCTYENCNRVYTRNSNLKQHIKLKHLKIKQECEICSAKLSTKATLRLHLKTHCNPKDISQPTIKIGRKERCDKGGVKTSTALKIAGLLVDPEDKNVRRTFKTVDDPATELEVAKLTTVQDIIADAANEKNLDPSCSVAENSITAPVLKCDSGTCNTMEASTLTKVQESLDITRNHHDSQQTVSIDNSMQQLCAINVS